MRTLLLIIGIFLHFGFHAQKQDYNWTFGNYGRGDVNFGVSQMAFTDTTMKFIVYDSVKYFNFHTNTSISTNKGIPRYYSNGMEIRNANLNIINKGDTINYNDFWEWNRDDNINVSYGLRFLQGMIILPIPQRESTAFVTLNFDLTQERVTGLFYNEIDDQNENIVLKDSIISLGDSLNTSGLTACRHANGRDWWIVVQSFDHSAIYSILFTKDGFSQVNVQSFELNYINGIGQAKFSPQGNKLALFEVEDRNADCGHLSIFDFDRCTGMFSNLRYKKIEGNSLWVSCIYSPNGRYFYTCNGRELDQYDMSASDVFSTRTTVAYSDGFESDYGNGNTVENFFSSGYLAPDGKIYITGGATLHMHRINFPDENHFFCDVEQHIIKTVSNTNSIPNFPNYRLGPLDGSPCDTLGIDNIPVAKFRYDQDTLDPLNMMFTDLSYFEPSTWEWDFGDGTTYSGNKPYYHKFPEPGVYKVCLTVSNEYGEHTMCQTLNMDITSSNEEIVLDNVAFPNPFDDILTINIQSYVPQQGTIELYNLQGNKVLSSKLFSGLNALQTSTLLNGVYVYIIKENGQQIGSGKVIKN